MAKLSNSYLIPTVLGGLNLIDVQVQIPNYLTSGTRLVSQTVTCSIIRYAGPLERAGTRWGAWPFASGFMWRGYGGHIYLSPSIPVHALSHLSLFSVHLVDARWKIQTFSCLAFKNPLRMQPDIYRRQCLWNNMKSLSFQYKGSDRLGFCKRTSKLLLGVCNKSMKNSWCAPLTHHKVKWNTFSHAQINHSLIIYILMCSFLETVLLVYCIFMQSWIGRDQSFALSLSFKGVSILWNLMIQTAVSACITTIKCW